MKSESWCGRGDLNPHAFRRHPLKMVCLPVPPLPQVENCFKLQCKSVRVLSRLVRNNVLQSVKRASGSSLILSCASFLPETSHFRSEYPAAAVLVAAARPDGQYNPVYGRSDCMLLRQLSKVRKLDCGYASEYSGSSCRQVPGGVPGAGVWTGIRIRVGRDKDFRVTPGDFRAASFLSFGAELIN